MTKLKADHDHSGLEQLDVFSHPARDAVHFRRIIVARQNLATAEQELRDAVHAARQAGDSWTIIGTALDTSRQAAQQRSAISGPRRHRSRPAGAPDVLRRRRCRTLGWPRDPAAVSSGGSTCGPVRCGRPGPPGARRRGTHRPRAGRARVARAGPANADLRSDLVAGRLPSHVRRAHEPQNP